MKEKIKKIGDGYWNYRGFDIYAVSYSIEDTDYGIDYDIFKGCDLIVRLETLEAVEQYIDATLDSVKP